MARQLSKYRHEIKDFKFLFLYVLAPLIVICSLILPNNFSTSALIFLNGLVLMFVAKVNIKYIASIGCSYCFMEVSSHSLDQNRIKGLRNHPIRFCFFIFKR